MQIMRQRRIERGALTLASPEVKFEIDTETHDPLDVGGFSVLPCTCYGSVFLLTSSTLFSSAIFLFLLLLTMWVVMLCLFVCFLACVGRAGMYQVREANQMVEEFMLAANISVAEKILKHFPAYSLLRSVWFFRQSTVVTRQFHQVLTWDSFMGLEMKVSRGMDRVRDLGSFRSVHEKVSQIMVEW